MPTLAWACKTNPIKKIRVSPPVRVAARLRSKPMGVYTPSPTIGLASPNTLPPLLRCKKHRWRRHVTRAIFKWDWYKNSRRQNDGVVAD